MSAADLKLAGEVFVTLFVIMDPPGTVPLFLSLTSGRSHAMRKRLAGQAVIVAFFVITVFALFGQQILDYLGITRVRRCRSPAGCCCCSSPSSC